MHYFQDRDQEFAAACDAQNAALHYFFYRELRTAAQKGLIPHLDLAAQEEELVQQTMVMAFMNSRSETLLHYTSEQLIWLKAGNVLSDYLKGNNKRIEGYTPRTPAEKPNPDRDPFQLLDSKEELMNIYKEADKYSKDMRAILVMMYNGLPYKEIAEALQTTEGAIKMKVSRFKRWIHKKRGR
ncbi:MAG TPA: sigma-70 family RNA polymerase sigma factor [Chitinophaga sp.]|uniref:RNA polymerase sigma factor n=1 Tax=Chitinophaga sp. TaxID=1869181 RepID=UPI002DBF928F|nr:sigma-70 family RNA polymerase sigma factor [Chitinophaga sp.]HEU4552464.1 sigma-70 family RNA polymerase sigma factor [Chitinophaga sp.]